MADSVTILPQTPTLLLDAWRMDSTSSQARNFPGSVSRFPVQSGREGITDAVDLNPDVLQISGTITDTPIRFQDLSLEQDRANRLAGLLEQLRAQRTALTILTSWTPALRNRWISSFTLTKDANTGRSIKVSMTIEKLRIARVGLVPQQLDADIQLLGMSTVTLSGV